MREKKCRALKYAMLHKFTVSAVNDAANIYAQSYDEYEIIYLFLDSIHKISRRELMSL